MTTVMNKRLGHFSISLDTIEHEKETVLKVMSYCIIVRAEVIYAKDCIDYTAIVDTFREVKPHEEIPTYYVLIKKNESKEIEISFKEKVT